MIFSPEMAGNLYLNTRFRKVASRLRIAMTRVTVVNIVLSCFLSAHFPFLLPLTNNLPIDWKALVRYELDISEIG